MRNDDNNNMPKLPPMRQSNSSSNLIDSRYYLSDDQANTLMRSTTKISNGDRKGLVKRTKSFWRFGRQSSDSEILEGMALWKHRDLVDVNEKAIEAEKQKTLQKGRERPVVIRKRDRSNDSDKTLNAKQQYEESKNSDVTLKAKEPMRHRPSFNDKQKLSLPPRQEFKESKVDSDFDAGFDNNSPEDDQFYDDGDGLMLRTVNRKNILQQYSNDSTGSESDSESIITSDDPYDCIVVDDQTTKKVKKNGNDKFPNVAEIGKKLEKLSKNAKYSPESKESVNNNQFRNSLNEKNNNVNMRNERNMEKNINSTSESEKREIIKYRESREAYGERERHSFATFGHDDNSRKGEEQSDVDTRNNKKSNTGKPTPKQRYHPEPSERSNVKQENSRGRQNGTHEKMNGDSEKRDKRAAPEQRRKINSESSERKEKLKYYSERLDASADEYSDAVVENRQFLPRTKLSKSSTSTMHDGYEHESAGLMDYGETLQNRLKSPDYGSKFDEKSAATGNMYGPWYDLWGLDASVRK